MAPQPHDSRRPQPAERSPGGSYEYTCPSCGTKYLAKSSGCPNCRSIGGQRGEEFTKKVDDPPDLLK